MKKLLSILFIGLLMCVARASAQTALVYLSPDTPMDGNVEYVRDARPYERDAFLPEIQGSKRYVYKKSVDVCWYLYPVHVESDAPSVLYLNIPCSKPFLTVRLNGQPLSTTEPVEINLTETAELHLATEDKRALIRLCFSNLPIVSIETQNDTITKVDAPGTITIFDPDYEMHGAKDAEYFSQITVSYRGNTSLVYSEKRSISFSLVDENEEKINKALAGLRNDSDWLLDAAFNDASRTRNRVCMDVWTDICRLPWNYTLSGATKGHYTEVYVNGNYRGLYCLGEKQDRKQLGLRKYDSGIKGLIVRSTNTEIDGVSTAAFHDLGKKAPGEVEPAKWYNQEIRFPNESLITEDTWQDFYDFTVLVEKGSKDEFAEKIGDYVYLNNIADYYLFNNALALTDNMRKNMTYVQYDRDHEYLNRFLLVPWDMDASLGRNYSSSKSRTSIKSTNPLFTRLINENPGNFRTLLYNRWQELKEGALSLSSIIAHAEYYYNQITAAGAAVREIERHPEFTYYLKDTVHYKLDFTKELNYIRTYMEAHLQWWDEQMEKYKE